MIQNDSTKIKKFLENCRVKLKCLGNLKNFLIRGNIAKIEESVIKNCRRGFKHLKKLFKQV